MKRVDAVVFGHMKMSLRALLPVLLSILAALPAPAEPPYAGRPLAEALRDLERQGLRLIFTDQVVRPEMRVHEEPGGRKPRAVLDALLRPHGLEVRRAPGGILMIVRRTVDTTVPPAPPQGPLSTTSDEIDVVSKRLPILGDDLSSPTIRHDTNEALIATLEHLPNLPRDAVLHDFFSVFFDAHEWDCIATVSTGGEAGVSS